MVRWLRVECHENAGFSLVAESLSEPKVTCNCGCRTQVKTLYFGITSRLHGALKGSVTSPMALLLPLQRKVLDVLYVCSSSGSSFRLVGSFRRICASSAEDTQFYYSLTNQRDHWCLWLNCVVVALCCKRVESKRRVGIPRSDLHSPQGPRPSLYMSMLPSPSCIQHTLKSQLCLFAVSP